MTYPYQKMVQDLLFDLESLDAVIGPEGLYAAEEHDAANPAPRWHLEWERCFIPRLEKAGATFSGKGGFSEKWNPCFGDWSHRNQTPGTASGRFQFPGEQEISIDLVKISKIKIRKYGNSYRLDPHFDFEDRWAKLRLGSYLKHYRPERSSNRFLLVVGFDSHTEPLRQELTALENECAWEKLGWSMITHFWEDPHHRGFKTRASIWIPSQTIKNHP